MQFTRIRISVLSFLALGIFSSVDARDLHRKVIDKRRLEEKSSLDFQTEEEFLAFLSQEENSEKTSRNLRKDYGVFVKKFPNSKKIPEILLKRGILFEENKQFASATKQFRKIIEGFRSSAQFSPAIESYFRVAQKLIQGNWFHFKDYDKAIECYTFIIDNVPFSEYALRSLWEISDCYAQKKDFVNAVQSLERLLDEYPDCLQIPEVYLRIAEIYRKPSKGSNYDQGGALTALNYYADFCKTFPFHEKVPFAREQIKLLFDEIAQAKILVGDFYFNSRNNPKAACILYREAIDAVPPSDMSELAQQKIIDISHGALPKKTPVDFLFGRYKPESMNDWIQEALIDDRAGDQFVGRDDRSAPPNEVGKFIPEEDIHGGGNSKEECCEHTE